MLESNPPSNTRLETQRDDERSGRDILPSRVRPLSR